MKQLLLSLTTLFLATIFVADLTAQERKVMFIGIDGVRSDALMQANTPNIDALLANGIYTFDSWHLGITVSGPSWSTMLTGVWEAKHKVTGNSYAGANYGEFPYFPNLAKQVNPDLKAVQIITWNPMGEAGINAGGNVFNSMWDRSIDPGDLGQGVVTATAKIQLLDPDLDIFFIHYDEVDAAGHSLGFSPDVPTYMNAIEGVDAEIGEVMEALRARPTYDQEDWLILATTDHGGLGFGHGGNSNQEREIWWFASGDNIPNVEIFGEDPGSYQMPSNPVDPDILANTPVLADIAVTALDWILPDVNPEEVLAWNLDGKSWLNVFTSTKNQELPNPVAVYPNPATGILHVQVEDSPSTIYIRLVDLLGRNVNTTQTDAATGAHTVIDLDVSDLPRGMYSLEISDGQRFKTEKVILK